MPDNDRRDERGCVRMDRVSEVSVIVPVFNGMPHIERTIESLLGQTVGFERLQVLIVDDGSTDDTPAFIDQTVVAR